MAARTNTRQCSVMDPAVAEAMSVFGKLLSWIKELQMVQVCVESDALVNAIKHGRIIIHCFTLLEEILVV